MKTAMSTREIVGLAILIVLNILFADVLAIPIAGMQFDFGFISAAAMGMIFGANKSALASGISDIMGALILPHGTFFVGFTISAICGGYICGKFLHDKPVSIKRSIMLSAALSLVIDLLLNSTWLYFFFMNKPMTSQDFKEYVYRIADKIGFDREKVILGGDHLGPLPWADRQNLFVLNTEICFM